MQRCTSWKISARRVSSARRATHGDCQGNCQHREAVCTSRSAIFLGTISPHRSRSVGLCRAHPDGQSLSESVPAAKRKSRAIQTAGRPISTGRYSQRAVISISHLSTVATLAWCSSVATFQYSDRSSGDELLRSSTDRARSICCHRFFESSKDLMIAR